MRCKGGKDVVGPQHAAFGRTTVGSSAKECLIVAAVRENVSGRLYFHDEMQSTAAPFKLEVVERQRS